MTEAHFYGILLGAWAASAIILEGFVKPRRWRREYLKDWQSHDAAAFHPSRTPMGGDEQHCRVRRVADEWRSQSGRCAVRIKHGQGSGIVVHEVNKNGTFSGKGPYFIKNTPRIWEPTGRRHIVETEVDPRRFVTTNPSGGRTGERGLRVLEFDTKHYAPMSLRQYGEWRDRNKATGTKETKSGPQR